MAKYRVTLTEEERDSLRRLVSKGKGAARKLMHARVLLLTDASAEGPGRKDEDIRDATGASLSTIARVRQRFVEESSEAALVPRPAPPRPDKVKIQGDIEKQLITIACDDPPAGRSRWTLQLLAGQLVQLKLLEEVSRETVRQTLKKTAFSRGW
jgi:homeodomain-containing protein